MELAIDLHVFSLFLSCSVYTFNSVIHMDYRTVTCMIIIIMYMYMYFMIHQDMHVHVHYIYTCIMFTIVHIVHVDTQCIVIIILHYSVTILIFFLSCYYASLFFKIICKIQWGGKNLILYGMYY